MGNEIIDKYKKNMDKDFEKNKLKPGDEGYVYDKRQEFKGTKVDPTWEIDDDLIIS